MTIETAIFLTIILVLAFFLRFYHLKKRGLLYWDDGVRMQEVLFLEELASFLKKNLNRILAREISLKESAPRFRGLYHFDSNPLNIFCYWVVSLFTKNIEFSGLVANAVLGVLSVLGTFFLAQLVFGTTVGLLSALVLALSAYHLNYSRSIYAEVSCSAFYVWGTYFYFLSFRTNHPLLILLAGFFIGCAFTCNSRQFYLPFFFVLYELTSLFFQPFDIIFSRLIMLGISMFLPLMLIEEFFVFLRAVGYPYMSYFMQLYERTGQRLAIDLRFPSFKIFWKTFYSFEGILALGFLIWGAILNLKNPSSPAILILAQCFFPILFWSSRPTNLLECRKGSIGTYQIAVPRLASSCIHGLTIVVAVGLSSLGNFFPYGLGIFIVIALWKCWKIVCVESGYKKAIEFIHSQGDWSYISFCHPISDYYASRENEVIHFDKVNAPLEELYKKNQCRYLLYVDTLHKNSFRFLKFSYLEPVLSSLNPIYSVELGYDQILPLYFEDSCHDPQIFSPCLIKVYDLALLFKPMAQDSIKKHATF
ncbi:MAG: hypothetical protein A3I11_02225 [Elusimicrobia bacterium RIFCSPLOWO2_02_FULL_39_32]|nr:MAG: hypothetical protein A3B80_07110 [Elusimicrobia bacterium RIFCSPHIGHO2_02_FULL_39_36]OGR92195.1 MAG: hypothetical protein A3I11_02225 [Elusimicrobia bacterium RIFCSPLOWO2_02_FULL_39_32]OGR99938.1 MAG: hypothetical protein A3G85_03215 [Elusimicrobia bacterium RIFCSPLOWO2_12_FULL_39_28]